MLSVFTNVWKLVSHLHTFEVAGLWLLRGGKAVFHSNMGFLGLSVLLNHLGIN
jgi:hypothetical protein